MPKKWVGGDAVAQDSSGDLQMLNVDSERDLQVDVKSSALPSGASTSALQTAGNSSLSTLAGAVSGSEMQADVVSVVPGTGSTNLGKAQGAAAGSTDTGVAQLGKYEQQSSVVADADGDYILPSLTDLREWRVRDQRHFELQDCNDKDDWTALNDDATTIADSLNHCLGTGAVSFAKANGTSNTVYAIIQSTITSANISKLFKAGGFVGMCMYLSSLTNVVSVFVRLGTSSSHYNQWTWPVADLTAGIWMNLRSSIATPDYGGNLGNGWNPAAVAYVAVGVQFSSESNTLSGILVDHIHVVAGRVTSSTQAVTQNTTVNTANMNIARVGNSAASVSGNGTVGNGTLRVTLASDSTGTVAITTQSYKGKDRTTTTGAAEELTIPANSKKAILSCGPSSQSYIELNGNADTTSPLYLDNTSGPLSLDLGSVTKLSAYVVAGNLGVVFFG